MLISLAQATYNVILKNLAVRPTDHRPRVIAAAQDLHIRLFHLRDRLRPATQTADGFAQPNHFCTNCQILSDTVPGKLICMLSQLRTAIEDEWDSIPQSTA